MGFLFSQGSLDLVLKFGVVFQQLGQSLQGLIQDAASFPGFHHGDAELITFGQRSGSLW